MKFRILICFFTFLSTELYSVHLSIRLSSQTGEFSQVGQDLPNTPYPNNHPDFLAAAWTNGGVPVIGRHFFKFELSQIPAGATIHSAKLNLFANPYPTQAPHSTLGGSNASYIRRVNQSWSSQTCTYNTQPTYTILDEVLLPASVSSNQDYLDIDVLNLIVPMVTQNQNFGFVLMLQTEPKE